MQGNPSTVIFSCGCTSELPIPEGLTKASLKLVNPDANVDADSTEAVCEIALVRTSEAPPVFIELLDDPRPEWARSCHTMVPFDIRMFGGDVDQEKFEPMFAIWRDRFGPMVPQCQLPDILGGRGRYFGIWKHQTFKGRRIGHLQLVETSTEFGPVAPTEPPTVV